jgi:hypothetical protein
MFRLHTSKMVKSLVHYSLMLWIILAAPTIVFAAPQEVFTDSATGYEIWRMTSASVNYPTAYYTNNPFSPNGKYIITGPNNVMNTDGTNNHGLSAPSTSEGEGVMGWWSHDSRYYFSKSNLYMTEIVTNQSSQVPNASSCLPFYFMILSPDGRTLSGISNSDDISSGTSTVKFINIDGTNCRGYVSPGRQTGGFDVTHGWLGNNAAWYLNDSQWEQYTDVPMVFNVSTGAFLGALNVGNQTWSGLFDHPNLSDSAYMIGGGEGWVAGNGSAFKYANTLLVRDEIARQLTTINGSVYGDHTTFSPNGKWVTLGAHMGNEAGYIIVFSIPTPLSTSGSTPIRVAHYGTVDSRDYANASFSPDSTKIAFSGDIRQTGNKNLYFAIFKKPSAPTDLKAVSGGGNVQVTFKPAAMHREIKEYQIYGSTSQNGTYAQIATVPALYTYLDAPSKITNSATSITVDSTTGFPDQGTIEIYGLSAERPTEIVSYTGKTATSFTGLTRGVMGSTAAEHWNDAFVWLYTGSLGYQGTPGTNSWFKVKSVEWSGLPSDFSAAVSPTGTYISPTPGSGTPTPTPNRTPTPSPVRTPTPNATLSVKSGDANGDNAVDETDYGIWLTHFGQTAGGGKTVGDFDGNGTVDGVDYVVWLNNFGK